MRSSRVGSGAVHVFDQAAGFAGQDGLDDVVLGADAAVDGDAVDACAAGDVLDRAASHAEVLELGEGGIEDLLDARIHVRRRRVGAERGDQRLVD